MTALNNSTKITFIAIDIAKKSHDALILWPNGKTKKFRHNFNKRWICLHSNKIINASIKYR